jgi:DNA-directed RNA polymerase subunit beta'
VWSPATPCSTKTGCALESGVDEIKVRSPITCETRYGVCAQLLRPRPGARPPGQHRRGGRRDRRAVDRRAGHAADHAYLPHRWRGVASRGATTSRSRSATGHAALQQHQDGAARARATWWRCRVPARSAWSTVRPRARALQGALRRRDQRSRTATRSRPARPWPTGIRTPIRSSRKWRASCASGLRRRRDRAARRSTRSPACRAARGADPKRAARGKDLRPMIKLLNAKGKEVPFAGHRHPGAVLPAAGAIVSACRRRQGVGRRRGRAYPAGILEDPRHHRRSAARGRPVRGAQAEGPGDPGREVRHRQLRQGHQGQAAPDHHRRRTARSTRS